jgi:para-nitrobenzyl esterase
VTTIPEPCIPGDSTLNVNVFTPAPADTSAKLPVLVWIHGGGFFAGSPASPWYDGAAFNRDGVVTVTISYRLGFDGFGWIEDAPTNRGVLDQIAALEWVQGNNGEFGGDPARVTIGGQSAGAGSVLTLLAIPKAQHLLSATIAQSGVVRGRSLAAATETGQRFARQMGVDATRAGWSTLSEDRILDGQQALYAPGDAVASPEHRATSMVQVMTGRGVGEHLAFVPHMDGELITEDPVDSMLAGVGAGKPLLVGSNAHEFTTVMNALREPLRQHDPNALLTTVGVNAEAAERLQAAFPGFDTALLLGQLMSERMFRIPLVDLFEARETAGAAAGTWLFDFRWTPASGGLAAHCFELPFVWDLLDAPGVTESLGDDPPSELATTMHRAWVRFIENGDPGWPACSPGERPGMVFDTHSDLDPDPYRLEEELRVMALPVAHPSGNPIEGRATPPPEGGGKDRPLLVPPEGAVAERPR